MVHDQNGGAGQLWSLNNLSMASSVWKSDFKGNDGGFSYKDELSQRTQETEERSCSLLETKLFCSKGSLNFLTGDHFKYCSKELGFPPVKLLDIEERECHSASLLFQVHFPASSCGKTSTALRPTFPLESRSLYKSVFDIQNSKSESLQAAPEAIGSDTHVALDLSSWPGGYTTPRMKPDDLALRNKLPIIHGSEGATPLYMAALVGHKDMVRYLNSVTEEGNLTKEDHIGLLVAAITADLFDVAFHMLHEDSELAIV
ncbi:hypothetical protein AAG906_015658 [Vitis piasezkii]